MMAKLNLGIVGCGDIAGYTAFFSRLVPQLRLAACCDTDPTRLRAFARKFRIPNAYTQYSELLNAKAVDAVYLAVPHHLHHAMILAAVETDKPVLAEKPLARTLDEGQELVEAISRRGAQVAINYQYRYDRGCYALARAVQTGALGHVHSARINIPWSRQADYFEASPWHKTIARAGGGTLITQGSHFLDIVLWATGEQAASAMGYIAHPRFAVEVETLAHGLVALGSGALVNITSSMSTYRQGAVSIELYGDLGTGIYSDRPFPRARFMGARPRQERPPVWGMHALHRSLAGFTKWILEGVPYLSTAQDALPVLAAVDAIYRSAATGKREVVLEEMQP